MLNLLIVDDEPLAVRGVKSAVPWEKIGISSVYTAYHAAQAKEIFAEHPIDIMLCDIEMPEDSGLDLLSWVRASYPKVETVFLTCHADFAFAKQAIQLGSLDYLLKPIPPEDLEAVMVKAARKIREERELAQQSLSWVQHHPLFAERLWLDIVNLVIPALPEAIEKAMEERKFAYSSDLNVLPVMIHVQRWHKPLSLRDERILEYGLKNAAAEVIREIRVDAQLISLDRNVFLAVLLLSHDTNPDMKDLKSRLESYVSSCYRYFYCDLSCYIGEPVFVHELPGKVSALQARRKNNVAYTNQVFLPGGEYKVAVSAAMPDMKLWSVMLLQGSTNRVISEVEEYLIKAVQNPGLDASFLHQFHQDFLQIVYSVLKEKGIQAHQLFRDSQSIELSAAAGHSVSDLLEWIRHIVIKAMDQVSEVEGHVSVVEKIKGFITEHYDQDLSRETIASQVYLSPDYLDRMLKRETGMSMKEYLLHERMRIARELLSKTDMPVTQVATHVGFNNLSHFTKVFRKHTDRNPSDYRQHARK